MKAEVAKHSWSEQWARQVVENRFRTALSRHGHTPNAIDRIVGMFTFLIDECAKLVRNEERLEMPEPEYDPFKNNVAAKVGL